MKSENPPYCVTDKHRFLIYTNGTRWLCETAHVTWTETTGTMITLSRGVRTVGGSLAPAPFNPEALHTIEMFVLDYDHTPYIGGWCYMAARLVSSVAFDGDANSNGGMRETFTLVSPTTPYSAFDATLTFPTENK